MKIRSVFLALSSCVLMLLVNSSAFAQGVSHFAVLDGGNEVDGITGEAGVGDPDGFGSATVILRGSGTVCFGLLVNGVDTPTAAHIHDGVAGVNGPIVVTLTPPTAGNPGNRSGCVAGVDPTLFGRLRSSPFEFYVNVHTVAFPDGALRGQLF